MAYFILCKTFTPSQEAGGELLQSHQNGVDPWKQCGIVARHEFELVCSLIRDLHDLDYMTESESKLFGTQVLRKLERIKKKK